MSIDTQDKVIGFGRHKGERFQRLPVGYLRWMANEKTREYEVAEAELERRGSTFEECEISGHAVDRASLSCRKTWHENKNKDEGLHHWLVRGTLDAIAKGEVFEARNGDGRAAYLWLGLKWVVHHGHCNPTLITIVPRKRKK